MPVYANSPLQFPTLAQKGVPVYLFGSYNFRQANTRMLVSNSALTSNVATLTVLIVEGEIPTVGSLVTVTQTAAGSGALNVNRVALTAVSITPSTGTGTISYALTHANVTSVADAGTAIAEVPEVPETLTNNSFSVSACIQAPECDSQFTLPVAVTFPTMPTAATVTLQVAVRDINSEYTNTTTVVTIASSAYTAGPVVQATLQRGYFYRFAVTGVTGSGTIVAKIGG